MAYKLKMMQRFMRLTDFYLLRLPLPDVDPNIISACSIIASILFIVTLSYPVIAFMFLIATLFLGWLDGLVAKKYNKASEDGYMIDVVSDRFSEGIIFIAFFFPWYPLFALNCLLSIISYRKGVHIILPLRLVFVIYYFISLLG